jgi:hypothetical protein
MYCILYLPTNEFLYRQYFTNDILEPTEKRPLFFYDSKKATQHIKKLLALIQVYNNSIRRYKYTFSRLTYRRCKKYLSRSRKLEQGYADKFGRIVRRNKVTFYGDVKPFLQSINSKYPDYKTTINIKNVEFLVVKVPNVDSV